jgi:hypothetical protein
MSKLFHNFFSRPEPKQPETPVVTTSYSQPHVLQQRMREERMTHGETVEANLFPVRLENAYGKMVMYFCPMQNLEILNRLEPGDGENIPIQATVEGLAVPAEFRPGLYLLKNVKLTSNGTIQVHATAKTEWELV